MESSWRFNVWDKGLANIGTEVSGGPWTAAGLVARYQTLPDYTYYATNATAGNKFLLVATFVDRRLPFLFGAQVIPSAHPHFPYGLSVEPDLHT